MDNKSGNVWILILMAVWFGLVCGLLEGAEGLTFSLLPERAPWELRWLGISEQILWVAPVFNALIFLVFVPPIAVLASLIRTIKPQQLAVFLFSWLTLYNLLSLTAQLHYIAVVVLSTGVSLAAYRWTRNRHESAVRFVRRSLPLIGGLVVLVATTTTMGLAVWEKIQTLQLPQPKAEAPNVLLIVLDTLRADHLSSYGYGRQTTPNIDRFAEQGVLFEKAIANSSWTVPSHASLFTGEHVSTHLADMDRPLDDDLPTLSEELSSRGYATAGFVANTYWAGRRSGIARGFLHYEDYFGSVGDMIMRTGFGRKLAQRVLPHLGYNDVLGRKNAATINKAFLDWQEVNQDRPFFCFLNYMDVHDPYIPPPSHRTVFSNRVSDGASVNFLQERFFVDEELSSEEIQTAIDAYDSSLSYLDAEIGSLLASLDRLGLSENTIVIITSDHGESFGKHGVFAHGNSLYLGQIHVPLIFRYPNKALSNHRVTTPISLHSVFPTILELTDLKGGRHGTDETLTSFLVHESMPAKQKPVLSELSHNVNGPASWPNSSGGLKSLVESNWHFILHENGKVELYNLRADRYEQTNLAGRSEHAGLVEKFKKQLVQIPFR